MMKTTQFYAALQKVEEAEDDTIKVFGIASTESRDSSGEIIMASAIKSAIPGYLQYPALREMHGLQAAGRTIDLEVDDDNVTHIVAHVVDPVAIKKVKSGTYSGFSVGGKVTKRDKDDRSVITGIILSEISLVDRPCQAEAAITMWKADAFDPQDDGASMAAKKKPAPTTELPLAEPGAETVEKAADAGAVAEIKCSGAEHLEPGAETVEKAASDTAETVEEAEAVAEVPADPIAKATAALDKIDAAVASVVRAEDVKKGMYGVSRFADLLESVSYLASSAQSEAEFEGDGSPVPAKLRDWLKAGAAIFKDMAKEEADELVAMAAKMGKASGSGDLAKADTVTVDLQAVGGEALAKAISDATGALTAERDTLTKALADRDDQLAKLADRIEPLAKTVEGLVAANADLAKRFAEEPLPARTAGPGAVVSVSKEEDAGGAATMEKAVSDEDIAKALGAMSEDDRAMALIKASLRLPQHARFVPPR
jgi:hypothetical protein